MTIWSESQHYLDHGYAVFDIDLADELAEIRRHFLRTFDEIVSQHGLAAIETDADLNRLYRSDNRKLWVAVYDQLPLLPRISALANHPTVLKVARACGVKFPALSSRVDVLVNMPTDDPWRYPPHQDYPYDEGSPNAVVIWLPNQDTTIEMGALQVIPGSHKRGYVPHVTDDSPIKVSIPSVSDDDFVSVPLAADQCVAFSQFTIHRSGRNLTDRVRFSAQVRFNDLAEPLYAKRLYTRRVVPFRGELQYELEFPASYRFGL